jgi:hypothetical protein
VFVLLISGVNISAGWMDGWMGRFPFPKKVGKSLRWPVILKRYKPFGKGLIKSAFQCSIGRIRKPKSGWKSRAETPLGLGPAEFATRAPREERRGVKDRVSELGDTHRDAAPLATISCEVLGGKAGFLAEGALGVAWQVALPPMVAVLYRGQLLARQVRGVFLAVRHREVLAIRVDEVLAY